MFGPIVLIIASNESLNPLRIAVIPTIDMIPMTMPRTVRADRILLTRIVPSAITHRVEEEREADLHGYSFRRASIGSSEAARIAG